MTSWSVETCAGYRKIPPRFVRVTGDIGPFIGMVGLAVAEDERYVWVRFTRGGSYPPCDTPGTYGMQRDQLEDA